MTKKLVEGGFVGSEGSKLLAFIDSVEERDYRWSVCTNRDGRYKLDVLVAEGVIISAVAATIGEAVSSIAKQLVDMAMEGAPSA